MDPQARKKYMGRMAILVFADILGIVISYAIGLLSRFDFHAAAIPEVYLQSIWYFTAAAIVVSVIVFYIMRLYHSIWRYASVAEVYRIVVSYVILGVLLVSINMIPKFNIPRSCLFVGYVLSAIFCVAIRFSYRIARNIALMTQERPVADVNRVLLFGAGSAGREVLQDLKAMRRYKVCVIGDDNPTTWGRYLEGYRIAGGRDKIPEMVEKYKITTIIFAIPSASPKDRSDILNICKETGCRIQSIPGLSQIVTGEVGITKFRDVDIADLLGRDEVKVNNEEIMHSIKDKVVMVTGGGGSIGSELCRQIAAAQPKQLIIFDVYENSLYDIEQELRRKYKGELNLVALVGSVRNTNRVNSVLNKYKPDMIYHAAAHKHVPLMETSPNEAVKNNVMGTYKLANAAAKAGVKKFLLISTDKAVNPTSLMGATKRICEMIIQMMSRQYPDTVFMAVRFGNVLGSNGSVIPLFKKQIAEGGPVTVTDKNIIRYFMTIPEAVSLVLQAAHYAKGGEIFVLDMGKPVKIDDMARNLIKLSGFKPDVDIKIVYTGLRPGEKLYEELLMDEEGMQKTENELIYIGHPIEMNDEAFLMQLKRLDETSRNEVENMKQIVSEVVTTYKPDQEKS